MLDKVEKVFYNPSFVVNKFPQSTQRFSQSSQQGKASIFLN